MIRAISPTQPFKYNLLEAGRRLAYLLALESGMIMTAGGVIATSNLTNEQPTKDQIVSNEEGARIGFLLASAGALSAAGSLQVAKQLKVKEKTD